MARQNRKEVRKEIVLHKHRYSCHAGSGAVYGLGVIGAAIYFLSQTTTFWGGVLGILNALVWPAFLVYYWLKFLGI